MTSTIDSNSVVSDPTSIDDTDSPYTTSGEDIIQVDTSSGSVTVTLATADVKAGREIRVVDTGLNAGSNAITINTEGSETINPGSQSSITLGINGGYEDLWSDGSNWFTSRKREDLETDTFATAQADITNETFVRGTRSSDTSSTSSGTFTNIFDGESKDVRGEFNSSQQFSPDESGEYEIGGSFVIKGNTSQGDRIGIRVRNVTDNSTVAFIDPEASTSTATIPFHFGEQLDSSKTYEIQAQNNNSSSIIGASDFTEGVIKRSIVA